MVLQQHLKKSYPLAQIIDIFKFRFFKKKKKAKIWMIALYICIYIYVSINITSYWKSIFHMLNID